VVSFFINPPKQKNKPSLTHLLRPNDVQSSAFAPYPVAVKYSYEIVMGKDGNVKKKPPKSED
jgi:hypothetical protein